MTIAIHVENLSKCYTIAHQRANRDESLRAAIERSVRSVGARMLGRNSKQSVVLPNDDERPTEDFYALNDISFEVKTGERVGIVGANGAGKSTLLKILSRITEPTHGRITIRGRVSSLLEVGTGFHPELTGRENIFLNGAILGMPRSEIRKKFDEIVAFSEVERFLDTPVKHYSSGMYVRLAFSVSAHLDPEVLILDEVLAVGDARFQRKCLNKMRRFSEEGRTVLFVSHSAPAISQFCSTAIFLEKGQIKRMGPAQDVIEDYMQQSTIGMDELGPNLLGKCVLDPPVGDELVQIETVEVLTQDGVDNGVVQINEPVTIRVAFRVLQRSDHIYVPNLHIRTADGTYVGIVTPSSSEVQWLDVGAYVADCVVPANLLNDGTFTVQSAISSFNCGQVVHANVPNALTFAVVDNLTDTTYRNGYMQAIPGVIRPRLQWQIGASA
ncbi:ABC transporter ATP-binding protein [Cupriavidus sp. KK10]|jgi:lipopolysaccharide transport system ATP-binding protein|uniref:ABC transporter ATP-binding protein n=1 Tax=Cupriavidus sp. KK10 TaxID=1478019 RepID=UPI001BA593E4|nr:ABC transporter ATP-binding protein [Cupriavidus sp. KK10]QUN27612.1 ABC transporter ATP-binding protein [Cupriavidus sp. KK10]